MNIQKKFLILTIIIVVIASSSICAFAATVKASLTTNKSTYETDDKVAVTLTYSGTTFGSATAVIQYDASSLRFTGADSGTSAYGSSGEIRATKIDEVGHSTLSMTFYFTPLKNGNSTVTAVTEEGADLSFNAITANSASATVSVRSPSSSSASGNANLASLSVSAGTLSPSFSASRTSYTVNVDNDVTVCTISATPADSGASISVSGSMYLSVGTNTRKVTVTAENGTTKTYTITIIRSGDGSSSEGTDTEDPNGGDAQNPAEDIKVTVGDKEYIVNDTFTENDFPTGFTMTIAQYGDHEIPVIKDNALKYTLALLTDPETGDSRWFFYDEETDTFSERVEMTADEAMEYANLLSDSGKPDGGEKGMTASDKILFAGLGATVAALAVAVMVLQVKILRRKKPRKAPQIPYSQDQDTPDDASHGSGTDQMGDDDNGETGHEKDEPDTDPGADN